MQHHLGPWWRERFVHLWGGFGLVETNKGSFPPNKRVFLCEFSFGFIVFDHFPTSKAVESHVWPETSLHSSLWWTPTGEQGTLSRWRFTTVRCWLLDTSPVSRFTMRYYQPMVRHRTLNRWHITWTRWKQMEYPPTQEATTRFGDIFCFVLVFQRRNGFSFLDQQRQICSSFQDQ